MINIINFVYHLFYKQPKLIVKQHGEHFHLFEINTNKYVSTSTNEYELLKEIPKWEKRIEYKWVKKI